MILIFGGAYQGKLAYALERFNTTESDVYTCGDDDTTMPKNKKIIYRIDKWILALTKSDMDTGEAVRQCIENNRDAVVICDDISCGLVPTDPLLRKWREATGRSMAMMSHASDEVVRLFCGIPTRIK